MKSGPQRYPGASTAYWYQTKYGGSVMESNVIVWHTTEGNSLPDYSGGSMAPNFTARPNFTAERLEWFQHFDFDESSRALVNAAGGVETNTLNVCQVEIVGTCDPTTHKKWGSTPHLYTPELPDWAIRDLASFAKWAHENHDVPLTCGVTFKAYPGSYGSSNGVRMSASKWESYTGHCGHQHVPENLHGDPGLLPMGAILAAAKGGSTPSTPTTNTSTETAMKLSDQVALGDWVAKQWPDDTGLADKKISVNTAIGSGYAHARRSAENTDEILRQLEALRTEVAQLRAAVTKD
jgi:hypothetical protein